MKQTNERLCVLAQKGDATALDSLIDNNKSFIGKVANDLFRSMNLAQSGLNLDTDDLKQAGSLGLWKAVPKFDAARGMKFDLCGSCHPQRHDGHGTGCLYRF
jgi:RNA polymerase primary sigma factor